MKRIEKNQAWDADGNLIRDESVEVDVEPFAISKLLLRRALRTMSLEAVLNQMLESSPTIRSDWDDAPHLMSNDPILEQMIPAAAQMLQISEQQVFQILEQAKVE
jgi:hypothetical protein